MYTSNTLVSSDGFQGGVATPPGETPPVLAPVLVVELFSLLLLLLLLLALTPLVSRDASREPIFPSVPVVAVVAVAVAVAVAALPSAILILSLFSGGGSSGGANSGGGGALCVPCTWYLLPSMYIYIYTLSLSRVAHPGQKLNGSYLRMAVFPSTVSYALENVSLFHRFVKFFNEQHTAPISGQILSSKNVKRK